MSLLNKITRFAQSRQGRKLTNRAMSYARSPQGRRQIEQVRARLTKRGRPR
ncbi:MAG TPA: hypothetical protein VFZ00_22310 [Solirubrobacter sp.]|jgi:hypothetical protein|nr:hypothetical protein [Solirubrobacter sp.]